MAQDNSRGADRQQRQTLSPLTVVASPSSSSSNSVAVLPQAASTGVSSSSSSNSLAVVPSSARYQHRQQQRHRNQHRSLDTSFSSAENRLGRLTGEAADRTEAHVMRLRDQMLNLNWTPNIGGLQASASASRPAQIMAIPQTSEYHMDWFIERTASLVENPQFAEFVRSLNSLREQYHIARIPMSRVPIAGPGRVQDVTDNSGGNGDEGQNAGDDALPPAALDPLTALRNPDGSFAQGDGWDVLLHQMHRASNAILHRRHRKMRRAKILGDQCMALHADWAKAAGEVVSDSQGGYQLERTLEGNDGESHDGNGNEVASANGNEDRNEDGVRTWTVNLGYRRQTIGNGVGEMGLADADGVADADAGEQEKGVTNGV